MTIILILSFISFIIFCFNHNKKIDNFINSILTYKINNMNNFNKSKLQKKDTKMRINNTINIQKNKKTNIKKSKKNNKSKN